MIKTRNRYVIASAGITLHLMIGGVYAWSVFTGPIVKQTGWAETSVSFAFSLAIFFLGMSAAFMGRLVEKFGPTITGTISSVCYGLGVFLTGIAISNQQLWLLYLAYGVIGGLGLGAGYVTPVSTIIRWFPDKRGMATGFAVMGFGGGAILAAPLSLKLMSIFATPTSTGVTETFVVLGVMYFIAMAAGSLVFLQLAGWVQAVRDPVAVMAGMFAGMVWGMVASVTLVQVLVRLRHGGLPHAPRRP